VVRPISYIDEVFLIHRNVERHIERFMVGAYLRPVGHHPTAGVKLIDSSLYGINAIEISFGVYGYPPLSSLPPEAPLCHQATVWLELPHGVSYGET
jgi:hypothetical protein